VGAEVGVTVAEVEATDLEAEVAVTDSAGEVLAVMVLVGEVLAHLAEVLADAALVRDSAGRMDLRVEAFLVGEIAVASVIGVSVGEIAAFAIVGFAISKETLSILASMALDIHIIINMATHITTHTRITTDTRITTHTRITTIGVDSAGGATDHLNPVKRPQLCSRHQAGAAITGGLSDGMIGPESGHAIRGLQTDQGLKVNGKEID
jgi:hypothetical protein